MKALRHILWGLLYIFARLFLRESPIILMYHSISRDGSLHTVTPEHFHAQMKELAKTGKVVPLSALVEGLEDKKGRGVIAVTFDDGYKDFLTTALPTLREFTIPATLFVSGGDVDRAELGNALPLLSKEELRACADPLVEIGSHALSHKKLTRLSSTDARWEIVESRRSIGAMTGTLPRFIAYPKGNHSPSLMQDLADAHYKGGVTAEGRRVRHGDSPYALPRVQIDKETSSLIFRAKLTRAADWYYTLWSFSRRLVRTPLKRLRHVVRKILGKESFLYVRLGPLAWDRQFRKGLWDKLDSVQPNIQYVAQIIEREARRLGSVKVLDVGCGSGALAQALMQKKFPLHYTGIDFSEAALERARERFPAGTFILSDIEEPRIIEGHYDVIVMAEVFYYVDPIKTIAAFRTHCAPEGKVLISLYHSWRAHVLWRRIKKVLHTIETHKVLDPSRGLRWTISTFTYD